MIVIFNVIRLTMAVVGTVVAFLVGAVTPADLAGCGALALAVTWVAVDVTYRIRRSKGALFADRSGGHLFFVPIWMWGMLCLPIGAGLLLASVKQRNANEQHRLRVLKEHSATTRAR